MPRVSTGVITTTGTKGLLQWMQDAMPDFYAQVSPVLIAKQKQANKAMLSGLGCGYAGNSARSGMGQLGDDESDYYDSTSPTFDTAAISVDDSAVYQDLNIAPASTPITASAVASPGATSSGTASIISSLANAVSAGTLAAAQVNANNTLLQANLARAQQGLPPLTSTVGSSGMISLGSSSTVVILGLAGLAAFLLMGKKSSV